MKKFIIALFALISFPALAAQEKFTYYMMTTSNSPSIKITEPLITKLKETYDIDWKQNVGCAAKTQVDRDPNPIFVELVTGQYWMSLFENNTNCIIDMSKIKWVLLAETAYKVCVKNDSPVNNWEQLTKLTDTKFGYTSGTIGKPLIESLGKDNNATFRPVMLTNSNAALTALLAKDIDVAFLNVLAADPQEAQGNIKCVATTEKNNEKSLSKFSPKTNKLMTEWSLTYAVGLKNVNDQQYTKIVNELKNTLPKVEMPKNVQVHSIVNMTEKDLQNKVNDATVNLYAATK